MIALWLSLERLRVRSHTRKSTNATSKIYVGTHSKFRATECDFSSVRLQYHRSPLHLILFVTDDLLVTFVTV